MFLAFASCTCTGNVDEPEDTTPYIPEGLSFMASDEEMENVFNWASKMALSFAHDESEGDPVGYWYEAALPSRYAFCMRDASHQSTGAWILGLGRHNLNMMTRFVENIAESRDWCTYWEIDKWNNPCKDDYQDDNNFWYNLPANFDVMQACLKMYKWTGDATYVSDSRFVNFFDRTMTEYIDKWSLAPDKIMKRSTPHSFRGIASYVESRWDMRTSLDMLACMIAGCRAYEEINVINGDKAKAALGRRLCEEYTELLENTWWDDANARYHNFWYENDTFGTGEGSIYLLWFEGSGLAERNRATADICNRQFWNVENQSYMPMIMSRYGYDKEITDNLLDIVVKDRNDYPEVSYGVIEGIFGGLMGIAPDFSKKTVETRSHLYVRNEDEPGNLSATDIPVFGGFINLTHFGRTSSRFVNHTGAGLVWKAAFTGSHDNIMVNDRKVKAKKAADLAGNVYSYVEVEVRNGKVANASVE